MAEVRDDRGLFARWWHRLAETRTRGRLREALVSAELEAFENAYARHYVPGETKPPDVGRPYLLRPGRWQRKRGGVVLAHGFLAAPLETRALGEALCRAGYMVYGVRTAGHGTAPEDLAPRPWMEWLASVERGVSILETFTDRIALCGFSIGGCLSLIGAARMPDRVSAVVSICAPLYVRRYSVKLVPSIVGLNSLLHRVGADRFRWDYVENHPENMHINYVRNPLTAARELVTIMGETERLLPTVTLPALIIQASRDTTVHPDSGPDIFGQLGSPRKELTIFERDRHGIVNGEGSAEVFARVAQFLDQSLCLPRQRSVAAPASAPPQETVPEEEADQALSAS